MSTFCGRLLECDQISIDRFDGMNLSSQVFFLSHFHSDHMTGMESPNFTECLRQGKRLYTSHITRKLILSDKRFSHFMPNWIVGRDTLHSFIVPLESHLLVETQETCAVTSSSESLKNAVRVSFMPARHCLGSVMMLFEFGSNENVLYTGDFRLSASDWKSSAYSALRASKIRKNVKNISRVYYDSTFCDKPCKMVDRDQSSREVRRLCTEWLGQDPSNQVVLWSYANYGHEFLLTAIFESLGIQCHVTDEKYEVYKSLGVDDHLLESVTRDETSRIHACCYYSNLEEEVVGPQKKRRRFDTPATCKSCNPKSPNVRLIKVSMMAFSIQDIRDVSVQKTTHEGLSFYNVQYSCHSSLAEVIDMIKYLEPLDIVPNVVSNGRKKEQYLEHIKKYLRANQMKCTVTSESSWKPEMKERTDLISKLRQVEIQVNTVILE